MRHKAFALAGATLLVLASAASASIAGSQAAPEKSRHHKTLRVEVRDTDGNRVGTVHLRRVGAGVGVQARLHSLTPGFHGFHVHGTGICDPDAAEGPFVTAGGHYETGEGHGDHPGDLPSLLVNQNGTAVLAFTTDRFTLAELRDDDGSAIMVHSGRDNFANIPDRYVSDGQPGADAPTKLSGDAGSRAACGVIAPGGPGSATVALRGVDGSRVGTVHLRRVGAGVGVQARLHSLTPGFHGFHVHGTGICDPDAAEGAFMTAGGHLTTGADPVENHGDHPGDLPSLLVNQNGTAVLAFITDRFTLAELRDDDGSAIMVHSGRDNFANIPDRYVSDDGPGADDTTKLSGDAGSRAACGVIG